MNPNQMISWLFALLVVVAVVVVIILLVNHIH